MMDTDFERYDRQMKFHGFGPEGQEKLRRAKVLVVGAGGLGCPVLQYLTGAGIGTIGVADADTVSISNLHRQILHPETHLGMNKAESAVLQLQKLNSQVQFRCYPTMITPENVEEIVNKVVTQAGENDIILLHDCYESSVDAALQIVDVLKAEGYEFVTVDEILFD